MTFKRRAPFSTLVLLLALLGCSREKSGGEPGELAEQEQAKVTHALSPEHARKLDEASIATLEGKASSLAQFGNKALLLVNVASKCGNTPQYEKLEALHKKYSERGFAVVGFPCNQFGGQEPGNAQEIRAFCTSTYGVTFPMMEKIDVNGADRHPIYEVLTHYSDARGKAGDISWNFEKFLISADRKWIARFGAKTEPDAPELVSALEAVLPG